METILSRLALFFEVDQRADVHAAHGAMAVVTGDRRRDVTTTSRKRLMNSGSLAGATAVSSTKAIGFLSPLMPSSKPSPALRTPQIAFTSSGLNASVEA